MSEGSRAAVFDQIAKPINVGRGDGKGDAGSMPQTRIARVRRESPKRLKCQT